MKINYLLHLLVILLVVSACGGSDKATKFYQVEAQSYSKFINQYELKEPNLSLDRTLVNNDYPIEISLYSDNTFYYDLPNLGDGRGTWKISSRGIELFAVRDIFDMYLEIQATDPEANTVAVRFTDRFGPRVLKLVDKNVEK
jgi:hypothetical protein